MVFILCLMVTGQQTQLALIHCEALMLENMVSESAAAVLPGRLLEMQNLQAQPRLTASET